MREVGVEFLVDWEGCTVSVKSRVDARVGRGDQLAFQSGEEFLKVADTLRTASRVAERVIVVVLNIECCLETLPLFFGEQIAEAG